MPKQLLKNFWVRLLTPVGILAFVIICIGSTGYAFIARTWEDKRLATKVELTINNNLKILGVIHSMVSDRVHGGMRLLVDKGQSLGEPRIQGQVKVGEQTIPNLAFGSQSQSGQYRLVDSVTRAVGGTQTLFARVGDDFVRVSTNVIRDNERVIGTKLERDSKAYQAIRQGTAYYGIVYILNEPYLAGYEPMIGKSGAVIGIWYVGYRVDMQLLKDLAAQTVLPEDGFIAALDGHGNPHFHSPNVTPEKVRAMFAADQSGWNVIRKKFEPWDFDLIAAYPNSAPTIFVVYRVMILFSIFTTGGLLVFLTLAYRLKKLVLNPMGGDPAEMTRCLRTIARNDNDAVEIPVKSGDSDSAMADLRALQAKMRNNLTPIHQSVLDINGQIRDMEVAAKKLLEERNDEALINLQAQLRVLRRTAGMLDMATERLPTSWLQNGSGSYTYKNEENND